MSSPYPTPSKVRRRSSTLTGGTTATVKSLQSRLALFALIGLGVVMFISLASNLVYWLFVSEDAGPLTCLSRTCNLPDLLHIVALTLVWLICRRPLPIPQKILVGIDVALMAVIMIGVALSMLMENPAAPASPLFGIIALSCALMSRSVVVPSTPLRTEIVSGISLLPLWAVLIFGNLPLDMIIRGTTKGTVLTVVSVWMITIAIVATIASRIIFGLQRRVSQARQLGQYQLEAKLGAGGMGEVYRARHSMLRRPTAIKLIRADMAGTEGLQRFEREVQSTSALTHPNTIAIYDYGQTPDGIFYYAMELLDGTDLEELVQKVGPLPPERVVHLLIQVCGSLAEAHSMDLIHRDIKPANIFLCRRGGRHDVVKVLDFGLVKNLDEDNGLTIASGIEVMGTPRYMAPESVSDIEQIDARSDIYALGCVAYYLLTGTPPFRSASAIEVLGQHLHTKPESPSERLGQPLPGDLEELVLRCLSKNPAERPASADELETELLRCSTAGAWGELDARAWWAEHGDCLGIPEICQLQLNSQMLTGEPPGEGTLRLDVQRADASEWYEEMDVSEIS